jgi:hypothetical protein
MKVVQVRRHVNEEELAYLKASVKHLNALTKLQNDPARSSSNWTVSKLLGVMAMCELSNRMHEDKEREKWRANREA